jgi:tight adherence protein B
LGISIEEALNNLSNRIKSDDLNLVVTATLIARETGGDLAETYDRITHTIRERNKMQGRIRALTSQGKLQGIVVGLLPVAMLLLMSKIAPEIVQPLFTTFIGIILLVVVFLLELIGALLIKKIITIDI